jgi:hypothetical protein
LHRADGGDGGRAHPGFGGAVAGCVSLSVWISGEGSGCGGRSSGLLLDGGRFQRVLEIRGVYGRRVGEGRSRSGGSLA